MCIFSDKEVLPDNPKYWPSAQLLLFAVLSQLPVISSIARSIVLGGRRKEQNAVITGGLLALVPTYSVYLIWALGLGWVIGVTLLERVLYYFKLVWGGVKLLSK